MLVISRGEMGRMQFIVETVSAEGVRRGRIIWSTRNGEASASTPLCLPYTRAGAAPHLTVDVLESVLRAGCQGIDGKLALLSLPTLYEVPGASVMTQYQRGIHNFTNMKDHFVYLSVQDPPCPPNQGYNEDKNVSVWCKGGRHKVCVAEHLQLVEAVQPNVFECLCDSVSSYGQKMKRMRKSVDRTLKFLDETIALRSDNKVLLECGLLGAIEGSDVVDERKRSARETAKRPVDGFVLEGFDLTHSTESLSDILSSTIEILPHNKPRFTHGLHTPDEIFTGVENGVDVFDGSYPFCVSERGAALFFPNSLPSEEEELHCDSVRMGRWRHVMDSRQLEINLMEERFALDFTPLVADCVCYACSHHSRAYIHHLLLTNEILARVLLMIHNLSHYLLFFTNLRQSLANSSYVQFKQTCSSNSSSI